jgi:hypothetical protein
MNVCLLGTTGLWMMAGYVACAEVRPWTNDKGQVMQAEYVSSDGSTVELSRAGKTIRYELAKLSQADRDFVKERMAAPSPAAKSARTGWMADFLISKPAFPDTKGYLTNRNTKAIYKAFAAGDFPSSWSVNKKDAEHEFAYTSGKAVVYVPSSYDGTKPMGVYLHVSPGDGGENVANYAPVMDRLGLIYVSAKGTSNNQPMLRRVKLSVDALAAVKAEWKVDPKRVCVGGLSGGGHMAMLIHAMFPEFFVGSVSHAAQSYLPGGGSCGHFPGLEPGDLKSGPLKGHKWCVISGDKDKNYQEILKSSKEWEDGRFDYRFFDVAGMTHSNAPPEKLEEALRWLGVATPAS